LKDWLACRWTIIRVTVVGFVLGSLPGAGMMMATFFSYALEKRFSKHPEKFGTGIIEGVCAPETANNAATAGTMVPLFSLGIPPNAVMAMLLGAFIIHGIQPGPFLITTHPNLFWGIIASMYIGNVMLIILNLPLIGIWVKILKIPYGLLFPLIIIFCFVGVYSLNNNFYELIIMVLFGFFGYILTKMKYPPAPFLLGMILGSHMEVSLRQSLIISRGHLDIFLRGPFSIVLLILVFLAIVVSIFVKAVRKREFDV